jgi:hypothetical protein
MKTISPKLVSFYFLFSVFLLYSCVRDKEINSDQIILISILKQQKKLRFLFRLNSETNLLGGVVVQIYTKSLNSSRFTQKKTATIFLAFKGISSIQVY